MNLRQGLTLLLLLLLAGCLPKQDPQERAQTFIIAKAFPPLSLDPGAFATANDYPIQQLVYERLLEFDPEAPDGLAPQLAESWTFSQDGLALDLQLATGRVFESGAAVNAQAVAFSLQRVVDMRRWSSVYFSWLERVEITGEHSVRLHLNRPYQPALQALAQSAGSIIDPTVVREHLGDDHGTTFLSAHSAGSGPYRIAEVTVDGIVVLEPNPRAPAPRHFRRIEFRPIPDEGVRRLLLERGDIDFTDLVPAAFVDRYTALPGVEVARGQAGASLSYITLNTRSGPLADARLRQAVAAAIDYDALREQVLKGNVSQIPGYLPQTSSGFDAKEPGPRRDLARAHRLMAEAGYRGEEIELSTSLIGPVGEFLQSTLREAGLNVRIMRRDIGAIGQRKRDADFGMVYEGWQTDGQNPAAMFEALFSSRNIESALNGSGLSDPAIDKLIDAVVTEQDTARRSALFRGLDERLREQVPIVMIFCAQPFAAYREQIDGVTINPLQPSYQPIHTFTIKAGDD